MARIGKTNLTQLPSSTTVDGIKRQIDSSPDVKPQHLSKMAGALSQQVKELATKVAYFQEQTYQAIRDLDRQVNGLDGDIEGVSGSNGVASYLKTLTGLVNVSSASAPSAGQVLTAVSSTLATWQTPVTGSASASIGVWLADAPPSSSSIYDDEFIGVSQSLDAKWSLWNPSGNCSYGVEQNWGLIENQTGTAVEGIYQACPSGSFAVYAKVGVTRQNNVAGAGRAGIFLADNIAFNPTGSKFFTLGIACGTFGTGLWSTQASSYVETVRYTDYLNYANYNCSAINGSNTHAYFRIRVYPGGPYSCDVSSDGHSWDSVEVNANIGGFTPIYFGIYGYQYASAGRANVKFFRVFTGSGSDGQYNTSIGRLV